MNPKEPSTPAPPTPLHSKTCAKCRKPITEGQLYFTVTTPDGGFVDVHAECIV